MPVSILRLLYAVWGVHLDNFPRPQKPGGHHSYSLAIRSFPCPAATREPKLAHVLSQHRRVLLALDKQSSAYHTWITECAVNQRQDLMYHHPRYCILSALAFRGRIPSSFNRCCPLLLPPLALSAASSGVIATPFTAKLHCRLVHLIYTNLREGNAVQSISVPLAPDTFDASIYRPGKPR